jgi:hypothetical protein
MNGNARRFGYRIQGGLYSASARDGGSQARKSAAAIAMGQGRNKFFEGGAQ